MKNFCILFAIQSHQMLTFYHNCFSFPLSLYKQTSMYLYIIYTSHTLYLTYASIYFSETLDSKLQICCLFASKYFSVYFFHNQHKDQNQNINTTFDSTDLTQFSNAQLISIFGGQGFNPPGILYELIIPVPFPLICNSFSFYFLMTFSFPLLL